MFTYGDFLEFLTKKNLVNEFFEYMNDKKGDEGFEDIEMNDDDQSTVVVDDDDHSMEDGGENVVVYSSGVSQSLHDHMVDADADDDDDSDSDYVPTDEEEDDEQEEADLYMMELGNESDAEVVIRNGLSCMSRSVSVPSEFYATIHRAMRNDYGQNFKNWILGIPPIRSFVEKRSL